MRSATRLAALLPFAAAALAEMEYLVRTQISQTKIWQDQLANKPIQRVSPCPALTLAATSMYVIILYR
jgi:hypothetical protein